MPSFLSDLNINQNQLLNARLETRNTEPSGYGAGSIFFNSRTTGVAVVKPQWHDGSNWNTVWPFDEAGNATVGTITGVFSGNLTGNVTGSVSGNAGTVTNGVYTTGSYSNPSWITALAASKITGTLPVANGGTGTATGSITGTGALTFAAGGTDQNINLTPSGTGSVVSGGSISAPDVSTGTFTATGLCLLTKNTSALSIPNGSAVIKTVGTNTIIGNVADTDITIAPDGTGKISVSSKKIINLADPSDAQDAATKKYVDDTAQGLDAKASVKYGTVSSLSAISAYTVSGDKLTITFNTNQAISAYAAAIDNKTPSVNDRLLVKSESAKQNNGIWYVYNAGSVSTPVILKRTSDALTIASLTSAFVFVEQGDTLSDSGWVCTVDSNGTLGTTDIPWVQFSQAGSYTPGRGIVQDGTSFNFAQSTAYTAGQIPYADDASTIKFKSVTGTGNVVLATAPTVTGLITDTINVGSGTLVANLASYTGKVGIGTATPTNALDVNGVIRSFSSTFGYSDVIAQTTASTGTGYSRFILKTTDREWRLINDASTSGSPFLIYDATAIATRYSINSSGVHTWSNVDGVATAMTLNSTGLGIGDSPTAKLTVKVADSSYALSLKATTGKILVRPYVNSTYGAVLESTNAAEDQYSPLSIFGSTIKLGNGAQVFIDSSGNLGLGVAPSSWGAGNCAFESPYGIFVGRNQASLAANAYYNAGNKYIVAGYATTYLQVSGEHRWLNAPSWNGSGSNDIGFTQAMTLDASGSLLLGNTNSGNNILRIQQKTSGNTYGIRLDNADNTAGVNIYMGSGSSGVFGIGRVTATDFTINSTGAATFAGTVTAKSGGTGTGQLPIMYIGTITGDNSTTAFDITHNLANTSPIVQVWQKASPYAQVYVDVVTKTSAGNAVTITFATAPATSVQYYVTVLG